MDTPEDVEFSLQSIILETHPEVTISNFPVESMAFDTTQENKENASATECSWPLVDTITKYEILYENVVCVVTDGALVYLCEYLVDLVEYFSTLEEATAALDYFQDISNDKSLFSAEVSTGAIDTPEEVAFSLQSIILETHPEVTISDYPLETMAFDTTQENKESPLSTEVSTSAMDTPKEVALSLESIILETHPEVTNSNYPVESTAFDITHKSKESASFPSEVLTSVVDSLEDSLSLKPVTLRINPEVNISSKLVTDVNKTKEVT
uniref:Uncharacterized protein n=1 Tax=Timema genevievae TaxID=629358 RepID=A0A7R9K204_TIMGE|nr:unnamed protein product [Timema genevievae]